MSEWVLQKAAEFCASVRDGTHDSPKSVEGGGKPLVTSKVVKQGVVRVEDAYLISEKDYRKINERSKVDRWDILMTMIGTVGECAIVKDDPDYAIKNIALFKMAGDEEKSKWLYYYLTSPTGQGALRGNFRGSSQQDISLDQLRNLEVPVPEKDVRSRIVAILSDYDSAIDNARRQIALLEEAAMRLYREWFVVKANPKWEKRRLGELIETLESGSRPRGGALKAGVPSIGAEKVDGVGIYDFSNEKYISEDYFGKMRRGVVKDNDVLLYKDGAYAGKVSMIVDGFPHVRAAINEHVFRLRTKDDFAQHYLYALLRQQDSYTYYNTVASAKAAQPGLNQDDILDFEISFPSVSMFERYEQEVKPLFHSIGNQANKIKRLTEARDRLLPKLMSGEIEV